MKQKIITILFAYFFTIGLQAQLSRKDYERADEVAGFGTLAHQNKVDPSWVSDAVFSYKVNTVKGSEYFRFDVQALQKVDFLDQEDLTTKLNEALGKAYKSFELPISFEAISEDLNTFSFELEGFQWKYDLASKNLTQAILPEKTDWGYWGASRDELENDPVPSPDGKWTAFVRNYNVVVKNSETGEETVLSFDGSEGNLYSSYLSWSPDSKKLATYQVRQHVKKYFYFVEAAPEDQLQPKLHKREYLKPGDAVPIKQPALFDVSSLKQLVVDGTPFEQQFDLSSIRWAKDSESYTFDFNERGHQRYQMVRVDAVSGETKVIVEEVSTTYVEYPSLDKRFLEDRGELLWKSQRDGWFHLYLFDAKSGKLKRQLTKGEWLVRKIIDVNETTGQVLFEASGLKAGEDPYQIHLCRVNLDGKGFKDLTPENANHRTWLSPSKNLFLDQYSRVDLPPVFVLRETASGKVVEVLEEADISGLTAKNWKAPEVFTAKGRDGTTDIWGIIYRPTNFDPNQSYPVVEYIYAGPGSNYVPKEFRTSFWFSGLAELGFIVVQMDGMGTGNRSKAFGEVCWQNLKDSGFPDRMRWIQAAAKKYPYMDLSRVGLYGGSAGGQSTVSGLLQYPDFYKAGVAACGCYDNRMDKIWWNELWMGYPIGAHYIENSAVEQADQLQAELMLILGEMDDNVDPASTMQLVDALIKANKDFELVVLPGMNHTLGGAYGERKRRDFFIKNLQGVETPNWNK